MKTPELPSFRVLRLALAAAALGGCQQFPVEDSPFLRDDSGLEIPDDLPKPRIDRISLAGAQFLDDGMVKVWLYVQGANIGLGSKVRIDDELVPTMPHKALRNELLGVEPEKLAYPIYHYLGLVTTPGPQERGARIRVVVEAKDGRKTLSQFYRLPLSEETIDSDGDDIPDLWEREGYDPDGDGPIEPIDLPGLGADPYRPDVFVEVDVMEELSSPPDEATWDAVRKSFADAPLLNPRGDDGIHLVIDASERIPFTQLIGFGELQGHVERTEGTGRIQAKKRAQSNPYRDFYDYKKEHFDNARRGRIYHYCIWGSGHPLQWSGESDVAQNEAGTDFIGPGDDFMVTMDDFGKHYWTLRARAETFMHELGHDLQQRHGGKDHEPNRPTYNSVMSYSWQLRTGHRSLFRRKNAVTAPFYYGEARAEESGFNKEYKTDKTYLDYSEGMQHGDYANWANLVFSGPRLNGRFGD